MKNAERQLQAALTESLLLNLSGLNEQHTKKLHKTVARAVKQLARKFAKLTAKELKGHKKAAPAIHALPKPVIAAINGAAVGIGATMTLAMDIRLASTKARIGFVFGRLGIVPEATSSWFLPRIVGIQQALEWVYSAEILTAEAALAGRLVRSVHEPDDLLPVALELARTFVVDRSPVAVGLAKQLLYRNSAAADPLEAHLSDSLAMFYTSVGDGKEGVAAFLEKRDPHFTGRASDLPRVFD